MGQGPDEIRRDIEATRQRMDRTLDQLENRVSPRRIAQRRGQRLRARWAHLKETMMGSNDESAGNGDAQRAMRDRSQQAAHTLRGAPEATRRRTGANPLVAGAIAFGAGMLGAALLPRTRREQDMASEVAHRLEPVADEASSVGREIASQVQDRAREGAQRTREAATGAAERLQADAQDTAETVQQEARESAQTVRSDAGDAAESVRSEAESARQEVGEQVTGDGNGGRPATGDGNGNGGRPAASAQHESEGLEDRKVEELQRLAAERDIPGRSTMTKSELIEALRE